MPSRPATTALLAALMIAAPALCAGCDSAGSRAQPSYPVVSVAVGSQPSGRPLAPGFVGLSFEYNAITAYTSPLAVRLIRDLAPGQRPVLRVGGNTADETWWPQRGRPAPRGAGFALSASWLHSVRAIASRLDARLIMGLNLAGDQPSVAVAEAREFLSGIGGRYLDAFEIGNEPDLYGLFPWYVDHGHSVYRRPANYSLSDYIAQFTRWRAAIGRRLPVAGPAFVTYDWPLAPFIRAEPGLRLVTFHQYPLDSCLTNPSATGYPTLAHLLSDRASSGLATRLAPVLAAAHARGLPFRLDELNSASCGGRPGVSNTFASALWMLDTLFNLAKVGVAGVNVHMFPGAAYAPFSPTGAYPEYYGILMFTRAFPPGARLLPTAASPGAIKAWATDAPDHTVRVVLINKSPQRSYDVALRVRGLSGRRQLERLRAPSVSATSGVTLGGWETVSPSRGVYTVTVPAASAVLLTK